MAPMPHCITPQASVSEAAQLMLEYKISALPVMRDGTLIGIVTTTDLLKLLVSVSV
jgi:CBS domain-containing protein